MDSESKAQLAAEALAALLVASDMLAADYLDMRDDPDVDRFRQAGLVLGIAERLLAGEIEPSTDIHRLIMAVLAPEDPPAGPPATDPTASPGPLISSA